MLKPKQPSQKALAKPKLAAHSRQKSGAGKAESKPGLPKRSIFGTYMRDKSVKADDIHSTLLTHTQHLYFKRYRYHIFYLNHVSLTHIQLLQHALVIQHWYFRLKRRLAQRMRDLTQRQAEVYQVRVYKKRQLPGGEAIEHKIKRGLIKIEKRATM